jgi:hypothetical protein
MGDIILEGRPDHFGMVGGITSVMVTATASLADRDGQAESRGRSGPPPGGRNRYATDLVGLFKPDVLLSQSTVNLAALQRATRTIPIVFLSVADPVEQGFVPNLTH